MYKYSTLRSEEHIKEIESTGVVAGYDRKGFGDNISSDLVYPYFIISLCMSGEGHALYDMKEISMKKNDMFLIMPGHIVTPLGYSEDYQQAWLLFDPSKFTDSELKFNSQDLEHLLQAPLCQLNDDEAQSLLSTLHVIAYIISRTEEELPNKHRILENQLSLAYELYMSMRRDQDQAWEKDRMGHVYLQFCDHVVAHYKEERNVNYYARLLGYDQRYFSKVFKAYSKGISPLSWIQQYVATQAKRIMSENPRQTVKATALQLGFPTTANFCRYFKRATGMTPNEWQQMTK